jgi:hypothetical protein
MLLEGQAGKKCKSLDSSSDLITVHLQLRIVNYQLFSCLCVDVCTFLQDTTMCNLLRRNWVADV